MVSLVYLQCKLRLINVLKVFQHGNSIKKFCVLTDNFMEYLLKIYIIVINYSFIFCIIIENVLYKTTCYLIACYI